MSDHALLITDTPSIPSTVAEQACGVRVLRRRPQELRREDWDQASRVLVDAPAVSVLASRTDPLPERDGVLLLADPEDRNRPELYRQALGLGAAHVLTLGPSSGVLRTHLAPHGQRRVLTVGIVDPDPSGVVGTATLASLGIAGAAADEPLRLLDARPTRVDLHQALQRARHALPAPGGGRLHTVCAPHDQPPPFWALQQAISTQTTDHAVTLVHLDPRRTDTAALLADLALVIIATRSTSVTGHHAHSTVSAACRGNPHVHVHVLAETTNDLSRAAAAGIGASYPSLTGAVLTGPPERPPSTDGQLVDTTHQRRLYNIVARYRPHSPP